MANTYTQILYHIVFSTKNRIPAITPGRQADIYRYMWGIVKNKDCHLYRIGGVEDHVHVFTSLHPSLALAELIRDLKADTTNWIRREGVCRDWPGWQDGYSAFTLGMDGKDALIEYIRGQEAHHKSETFVEELKRLLAEAKVTFEEKYLE